MANIAIEIDKDKLRDFCQRWKITEFAQEFRPDSDVDVLVAFERNAPWSLLDWADMEDELAAIFGRPVDLVERGAVEKSRNRFRKSAILTSSVDLDVA